MKVLTRKKLSKLPDNTLIDIVLINDSKLDIIDSNLILSNIDIKPEKDGTWTKGRITHIHKYGVVLSNKMESREKFFEDNNVICTCRIGYVVCQNCYSYYHNPNKLIKNYVKI